MLRREPCGDQEEPGEAPAPQEIRPAHGYPHTEVPGKLSGIIPIPPPLLTFFTFLHKNVSFLPPLDSTVHQLKP